ncbi:hypothetical protein BGW39_005952 [Mortierella sp. 14UC]|nr:hypothetical protein BGW39_005952 [Mortierella sp. 14UC]
MEQNLGLPSAVQEPFNHEGYIHEAVNFSPVVNGIGGGLVGEDAMMGSDEFRFVNTSGNLFASPPLITASHISGNICLPQQQPQLQQLHYFQQLQEQQALHHSQSIDPSRLSLSPEVAFAQGQQKVNGSPWPMVQYSTTQHILESQQQKYQETLGLGSQQYQQLTSQQQYCAPDILHQLQPHLATPPAAMDASVAPLTQSFGSATTATTIQHYIPFHPNGDILCDPNIQAVPIDFSQFRSPNAGHLNSPDNSPCSISEDGFFDQAENEAYFSSAVVPSMNNSSASMAFGCGHDYLHGPMNEITISSGRLFGVASSSAGPVSSMTSSSNMATITPNNLVVATVVQSTPSLTPQPVNDATSGAARRNNPQQSASGRSSGYQPYQDALSMSALFSCSSSSSIGVVNPAMPSAPSSFSSSITAMPLAPKRQQYIGTFSDDDDSDFPIEEEESKAGPKRRKRVRKAPAKPVQKVKGPTITLNCRFPNCKVTCSSHPSLNRHELAHRWRGQFSPVRCEACRSSLSNEFSVQRHILRSAPTSRCHKMRIYSIMKAEDEIETTVKFFPTRGHGKKTVKVDLERMKAKYKAESWVEVVTSVDVKRSD